MFSDDAVEAEPTDFVTQRELRALLSTAMRVNSQLSDINFTPGRLPQIEVHGSLKGTRLRWKHNRLLTRNCPATGYEHMS